MAGLVTLGILGASLSVDAFAAAVGKGATCTRPKFGEALRIGAVFGFFEAITPLIGWAIGLAFASWIHTVDHWVAFGLLTAVGGHMLWQASKPQVLGEQDDAPKRHGIVGLCLTAIATSIDAMAVGVSLAVLDVDIVTACLVIGGVTTVVATAGVLLGKHAGPYLGRWAEVIGGLALIAIGCVILYEHLNGRA